MIKKLITKIKFIWKCKKADSLWEIRGGGCFDLFTPSFYLTHTAEETKRITDKKIAELKQILADYEKKHNLHKN